MLVSCLTEFLFEYIPLQAKASNLLCLAHSPDARCQGWQNTRRRAPRSGFTRGSCPDVMKNPAQISSKKKRFAPSSAPTPDVISDEQSSFPDVVVAIG
ncbi:hypothetical protein F511_15977 [Dorcoceras hygrometricum]|uniref:Uncharacterized protein n=1 Tax=Dorcoceras hygrometricum TaxID=472368 RepID=A0A2Z7BPB5_9LAMI|nr:hypothetical protein F511_15977 [Dorcoceras hygrometricum]